MNRVYHLDIGLPETLHNNVEGRDRFVIHNWLNDSAVYTYPRPNDETSEIDVEDNDEPTLYAHYTFIADEKQDKENKIKLLEYAKKDAEERIKALLKDLMQKFDEEIEAVKNSK